MQMPNRQEARSYQERRGAGDGRSVFAAVPPFQSAVRGAGSRQLAEAGVAFAKRARASSPPPGDSVPDDASAWLTADAETLAAMSADEADDLPHGPDDTVQAPIQAGEALLEPGQAEGPATTAVEEAQGILGAGDGLIAPHASALDVRTAIETASVLLFVSVLVQPLIYAHVNGFTVVGMAPPARSTRPVAMKVVQELCQSVWQGARVLAFLVGEYASGARLFAAPADFAPPEASVCRTRPQRLRLLAAGATFVWCTLSALSDTAAHDSAARSLLATQAFVKPLDQLADAARLTGVGDPIEFVTGVTRATSIIQRPILDSENSPPAWRALAISTEWDAQLLSLLAEAAGDALLDGWAEVVRPIPVGDIPPHLLENLPDFSDERLDVLPMPAVFYSVSAAVGAPPPSTAGFAC
jgi:hypothetical protein